MARTVPSEPRKLHFPLWLIPSPLGSGGILGRAGAGVVRWGNTFFSFFVSLVGFFISTFFSRFLSKVRRLSDSKQMGICEQV